MTRIEAHIQSIYPNIQFSINFEKIEEVMQIHILIKHRRRTDKLK